MYKGLSTVNFMVHLLCFDRDMIQKWSFFVPLLDVLAKELGYLMPKVVHKATKESSLNIYFSVVQKLSQVAFEH